MWAGEEPELLTLRRPRKQWLLKIVYQLGDWRAVRLDAQGLALAAIIGRTGESTGGSTGGSTAVLPIIISFFNYCRDESKLEGRCRTCFDLRI